MIHTYNVVGMSCGGCQGTVKKLLLRVPGIKNVSVDLKNAEATIEMDTHVPTTHLHAALKDHPPYQITEKNETHNGNTIIFKEPVVQVDGMVNVTINGRDLRIGCDLISPRICS